MALASTRFVELFCAVVETGNYTLAASQLGITPAAVSRSVARHEAELGSTLLSRTTRSMELTEAGRLYYEQCRKALAILEEAERSLSQAQGEPRGLVRISVPTTYGHYRVLPLVREFLARHPKVTLDIDISNQNVDFVTERFDLAVRMGDPPDSTLIVRTLEDAAFGVFGSPRYVEEHGHPAHPSELDEHTCIAFLRPSTGRALPWLFHDLDGSPFELSPKKMLRCSGDVLGCVTLARHSAGLTQSYYFIVEEALRRGELVEVLRPYTGRKARFSLLHPAGQGQSLAARRFADLLVERCARRGQTTASQATPLRRK
jgi:DNA-binding transcriptional LysR family regulator